MRALASLLLVVVGLLAAGPLAHAEAPDRRFALLIAHHDGGPGTARLRYAGRDADKMEAVLEELGGLASGDLQRLVDPDAARVEAELARLETRMEAAHRSGAHVTLVVYYSGHARNGDLRLGTSRLPLAQLRAALQRSVADVRIGILDACESGAITRTKGGRPSPVFTVDPDARDRARGLVLIASSADDEASQESDQIGGSFFTHYLVSGLRGDADASGDRRVTLSEVYQYAYQKTVLETADTRAGVQHPTYGYDLQGSGQLVLTQLAGGTSGLVLGAALEGRFLVLDRARGELVAELGKTALGERRIALSEGRYLVKRRLGARLEIADLRVERDRYAELTASSFRAAAVDDEVSKGLLFDPESQPSRWSVGARFGAQYFLEPSTRRTLFPALWRAGVGATLEGVFGGALGVDALFGQLGGQELSLGALSLPYEFLELEVGAELLFTLGNDDAAIVFGPRLAALYLRRSFPGDPLLASRPQDYFGLAPVLVSGLRFHLLDDHRLALELKSGLGVLPFGVDENRLLGFWEGTLCVSYRP